jgi:hypothetical protein
VNHFQEVPVTVHKTQLPWEFLLSASRNSLQSFELSRLGHAANLRKEIAALLEQWIQENSEAMLARLLMDQRQRASHAHEATALVDLLPQNGNGVSDNIFADRPASPPSNRGPA